MKIGLCPFGPRYDFISLKAAINSIIQLNYNVCEIAWCKCNSMHSIIIGFVFFQCGNIKVLKNMSLYVYFFLYELHSLFHTGELQLQASDYDLLLNLIGLETRQPTLAFCNERCRAWVTFKRLVKPLACGLAPHPTFRHHPSFPSGYKVDTERAGSFPSSTIHLQLITDIITLIERQGELSIGF